METLALLKTSAETKIIPSGVGESGQYKENLRFCSPGAFSVKSPLTADMCFWDSGSLEVEEVGLGLAGFGITCKSWSKWVKSGLTKVENRSSWEPAVEGWGWHFCNLILIQNLKKKKLHEYWFMRDLLGLVCKCLRFLSMEINFWPWGQYMWQNDLNSRSTCSLFGRFQLHLAVFINDWMVPFTGLAPHRFKSMTTLWSLDRIGHSSNFLDLLDATQG